MIEIRHNRDNYSEHETIIYWCEDYFGKLELANYTKSENDRWQVSRAFGYATFSFREEEDAVMFKLHWGGDWLKQKEKITENS